MVSGFVVCKDAFCRRGGDIISSGKLSTAYSLSVEEAMGNVKNRGRLEKWEERWEFGEVFLILVDFLFFGSVCGWARWSVWVGS